MLVVRKLLGGINFGEDWPVGSKRTGSFECGVFVACWQLCCGVEGRRGESEVSGVSVVWFSVVWCVVWCGVVRAVAILFMESWV